MLNQKSELQRALERHREMVSRKEAEREKEENYKSDPRTALHRAIELRAKHIQQSVSLCYRILAFFFLKRFIFSNRKSLKEGINILTKIRLIYSNSLNR